VSDRQPAQQCQLEHAKPNEHGRLERHQAQPPMGCERLRVERRDPAPWEQVRIVRGFRDAFLPWQGEKVKEAFEALKQRLAQQGELVRRGRAGDESLRRAV
jgi:hypothetical protein